MSAEQNKATVRRYVDDIVNGGNPASVQDLLAPEFRLHFGANPPMTADEAIGMLSGFRSGFPDFRDTLEDLIAEDDRVVARGVSHGTHQGEFMGIPATGKTFATGWISIFGLTADGKVREVRLALDQLGMLQQLGVIPAPQQLRA